MVTRIRTFTAEDLAAMPTDEPWELWYGELRKVPGAGEEASGLAHWIGALISLFVRPRNLGWVVGADGAFILQRDPDIVIVPDASFTRWENIPGGKPAKRYHSGRPDLAVEVTSPTDRRRDIDAKMQLYRDAGVPLVWWVYPDERQIEVYRLGTHVATLGEGDMLDGEDVIPGFTLSIAEIFS